MTDADEAAAALARFHEGGDVAALASYLGPHDPGFTLRTYVHLTPDAADRMRPGSRRGPRN